MFAVDTNILLYAAIRQFPEHPKAFQLVEKWRKDEAAWFVTWNVVYEFLRVSTHAAVLQKPLTLKSANEFIDALLDAGNLTILGETREHSRVLKELSLRYPRVAANLIHDFHTAVLLYEYGIRTLYSADTDFLQFDFLDVQDPVH